MFLYLLDQMMVLLMTDMYDAFENSSAASLMATKKKAWVGWFLGVTKALFLLC